MLRIQKHDSYIRGLVSVAGGTRFLLLPARAQALFLGAMSWTNSWSSIPSCQPCDPVIDLEHLQSIEPLPSRSACLTISSISSSECF